MRTATVMLVGALLATATPAQAHTIDEQTDFWDWFTQQEATRGLSLELLETGRDFIDRHPHGLVPDRTVSPEPVRRVAHPIPPYEIEALIRQYFAEAGVEWALRVSYCESRWDANAKNPRSSASGLFQHLARYWDGRSSAAGWGGADIFDPVANTAVAAWLLYNGGPSHWVCK